MPAGGSEAAPQADLAHPLEHRHERDVGDADRPHQQRDGSEQQEQRVEVLLHTGLDPSRLGRSGDLQRVGVGGDQRQGNLGSDELRRAHLRLHLDVAGRRHPELPARGALRDDDRVQQAALAFHVGEDPHDGVEPLADVDGRLVVDPGDMELIGRRRPQHGDTVGTVGVAGVQHPPGRDGGPHGPEQSR